MFEPLPQHAAAEEYAKPVEDMSMDEKLTELVLFTRECRAVIDGFQSSGMAKMFMGNMFGPKKG